jgi:hypothetical protein
MPDKIIGHTAQPEPADRTAAVCGHHDQIHAGARYRRPDTFRSFPFQQLTVHGHRRNVSHALDHVFEVSPLPFLELQFQALIEDLWARGIDRGKRGMHVQHGQCRIGAAGNAQRERECVFPERRSVQGHQERTMHEDFTFEDNLNN